MCLFKYALATCFVAALFCFQSDAKYLQGLLTSTDQWKFMDRFCFLPSDGTLQFTFRYPASYLTQSMLLYWDKPQLWESAYKGTLTCKEREELLSVEFFQIFRLSPARGICTLKDNNTVVECVSKPYLFRAVRARWWYMVISNCDSTKGLRIEYELWMRNGEVGNVFTEHFSADEMHILEISMSFFLLLTVMLILVIVVSLKLCKEQMFHTTYRIFLASVVLFFLSVFFKFVTFLSYGISGYKNEGLDSLSDALYAASTVLIMLMLLLLSMGYTVTCGKLPTWSNVLISIFMTSIIVGYLALYIVEYATFDPALVLYRWESGPGYGLIGLMLAAWLFYFSCTLVTIVKHRKKRSFYLPMIVFYSIWYIAVPLAVILCILFVPDYTRAKVVTSVEFSVLAIAQLFYLFLTWPSRANKNFPFHIRTTQIDIITYDEAAEQAQREGGSETTNPNTGFTDFSIFAVANPSANAAFGYPAANPTAAAAAPNPASALPPSHKQLQHQQPMSNFNFATTNINDSAGSSDSGVVGGEGGAGVGGVGLNNSAYSSGASRESPGSNPTTNLLPHLRQQQQVNFASAPPRFNDNDNEEVEEQLGLGASGKALYDVDGLAGRSPLNVAKEEKDEEEDEEARRRRRRKEKKKRRKRESRGGGAEEEGEGKKEEEEVEDDESNLPAWARSDGGGGGGARRFSNLPPL